MRDRPSSRNDYSDPRTRKKKEPPEEVTVRLDTLVRLQKALEDMSSRLKNQIYWLNQHTQMRSMHWRCLGCNEVASFSGPKPITTAIPCEKCHGKDFEPVE